MRTLIIAALSMVCIGAAAPAHAQRYTDIARVPGAWRDGRIAADASNAIRTHGFYQPSSLTVNVTGAARSGSGVVGRFNSISQPGATVNVARGSQTTFSLPVGVANRQLGTGAVQAPPGVTVQRVDVGGTANFTIRAR